MTDDVWASGDSGAKGADSFGGDIGEGLSVNQAFSVDMVFRNGLAIAREQTGFFMAAAAALGVVMLGPGLLSAIVSYAFLAADLSGNNPFGTSPVGQLVPSVLQISITLFALPFQQLVSAGAVVGFGRIVATGEADYADLWRNILPAVRGFLYSLVMGVILMPAVLVLYAWIAAMAAAVFVAELPGGLMFLVGVLGGLAWLVGFMWLMLGLMLGWYSAVLDDAWPLEALSRSWRGAREARATLFVTVLVMGFAMALTGITIYCLIGFALYPMAYAVLMGGFAAGWLLHARPEPVTRKWGFFERNPTGYF